MRLIQYESDIRPYLTALMIKAIRSAGKTLQIPSDVVINMMSPEDYKAYKLKLATSEYNQYGILQGMQEPREQNHDAKRDEILQ